MVRRSLRAPAGSPLNVDRVSQPIAISSKWRQSEGRLQPDLWAAEGTLSAGWEDAVAATTRGALAPAHWEGLRRRARAGVRNAYVTAYMPTATTSNIVGQNECFEPFTSNVYTRRTLAGEFTVVNRHLIAELGALGLWDDALYRGLLAAAGSVQGLARVPPELQRRYRTAREMHPSLGVRMAAAMAPFVCQSMSLNLFLSAPDLPRIVRFLLEGWRAGLKTGCYYVHTQPASGTQKGVALAADGAALAADGAALAADGAALAADGAALAADGVAPDGAALAADGAAPDRAASNGAPACSVGCTTCSL